MISTTKSPPNTHSGGRRLEVAGNKRIRKSVTGGRMTTTTPPQRRYSGIQFTRPWSVLNLDSNNLIPNRLHHKMPLRLLPEIHIVLTKHFLDREIHPRRALQTLTRRPPSQLLELLKILKDCSILRPGVKAPVLRKIPLIGHTRRQAPGQHNGGETQ